MGIDPFSLAAIGIAVSAAAGGASAHQAHVQEIHAGQAKRDATTQRDTLLASAQEEEKQQALSQQAEQQRLQQRRQIASSYGRASTLLTGPEGLGGSGVPLGAG